jgi:hypothetical protein
MTGELQLARYFASVDGADPRSALELVPPSLAFAFVRPDSTIAGGRAELEQFIHARPRREHRLLAAFGRGHVQLAVGESVEGDEIVGTFQVVMHIDDEGLIERYYAAVHPALHLRPGGGS